MSSTPPAPADVPVDGVLAPPEEQAPLEREDPLAPLTEYRLDPARPLRASGHLRRRQLVSRTMDALQSASALIAVSVLAFVVYSVVSHGASILSISFLTKGPPLIETEPGGGIAPMIVGTATLVAIAAAISAPIGILAALYMTEFAGRRSARLVRLALDLLYGVPTIVTGLFIFALLVAGKSQMGFAGAVGLAIIMLPLIARATQEALVLVPRDLRQAVEALGVGRWRAVRGVVLPSALGGILTATVLSIARAAGETAPLLFASSVFSNGVSMNIFGEATPNLTVYIYKASEGANRFGWARAWGAALALLGFILVVNIAIRAFDARRRARLLG